MQKTFSHLCFFWFCFVLRMQIQSIFAWRTDINLLFCSDFITAGICFIPQYVSDFFLEFLIISCQYNQNHMPLHLLYNTFYILCPCLALIFLLVSAFFLKVYCICSMNFFPLVTLILISQGSGSFSANVWIIKVRFSEGSRDICGDHIFFNGAL